MEQSELKNLKPGQLLQFEGEDEPISVLIRVEGSGIVVPTASGMEFKVFYLDNVTPLNIFLTERETNWYQLTGEYMAWLQYDGGRWWFIHSRPVGLGYDNPTLDQLLMASRLDQFLVEYAEGKSS